MCLSCGYTRIAVSQDQHAHIGMSLAEARRHREALMKERKVFINAKNEELEREFSLCEH